MGLLDFFKSAPAKETKPRTAQLVARAGEELHSTDSTLAGVHGPSNTPIHTLVERLSYSDIDLQTELHLRHVIRENLSDVSTALLYRRALEGDLEIYSEDEGLQDELRAFSKEIQVGYVKDAGSIVGLNAYLDIMGDTADEYGMSIGEKYFRGRNLERLVTPDMRTFTLKKKEGESFYTLIQNQKGQEREIKGGTIHSLVFKGSSSSPWPPAMIVGGVLPSEVLLRMIISLNSLWMNAGDPPTLYSIQYDKDATPPNATFTDAGNNSVTADANLSALYQAVSQVKQARRRGMSAEILLSVVGGEIKVEPVFGNKTTDSLAEHSETHFRIASGLLAQLSEVPSWVFASGHNRSEGLGSNRANAEASIAFQAAGRRRMRLEPMASDILNTFLLSQRAPGSVGNFWFEWTAPSIIDEKIQEDARSARANADASFVRTSYELYNPEGMEITEDQREYLERNGVLPPEDMNDN